MFNNKRVINYSKNPATVISLNTKYSYDTIDISGIDICTALGRTSIISDIKYNEFGQISSVIRGNGTGTFYE